MEDDIKEHHVNKILETIRDRLKPAEYYQQLIDLVEKMASVNTKVTMSQDEIKAFISEISITIQGIIDDNAQVSSIMDGIQRDIDQMKMLDVHECNKIHGDLALLLYGDKHKFMDMVEEVKREGLVRYIVESIRFFKTGSIIVSAVGTILGIVYLFIK